jgi:alkylhydroperoxidase family enzyme
MVTGRIVGAIERRTGTSADYLRELASSSKGAFRKFCLFLPLAGHRRAATAEQRWVAALTATVAEDCGSCVQAVVNQARADGVSAAVLRAVIEGRPAELPAILAEVHGFAAAVARAAPDAGERAKALKARLGPTAQAEIAVAIASARVFPTLKRGLGHAVSCSEIEV